MPGRSNESDLAVGVDYVAVKELRNKIPDLITEDKKFDNDFFLMLWLKAQKFNVNKAELMIRKALAWRKEQNLETVHPPEFSEQYGFTFFTAKDGRPAIYMNVGAMDFLHGLQTHGEDFMLQNFAKNFLQMENKWIEYSREMENNQKGTDGGTLPGMVVVLNIKDFAYSQVAKMDVIHFIVSLLTNMVTYFPAMFQYAAYVNVNKFFELVLSAVLPIISGSMTVETYGEDQEKWKPQLLKYFDDAVLDAMFV